MTLPGIMNHFRIREIDLHKKLRHAKKQRNTYSLTLKAGRHRPVKNALQLPQHCRVASKPVVSTWVLVCKGFHLLQGLLQQLSFPQIQFL